MATELILARTHFIQQNNRVDTRKCAWLNVENCGSMTNFVGITY